MEPLTKNQSVSILIVALPPRYTLFPYTTLFRSLGPESRARDEVHPLGKRPAHAHRDRKSTRLNSSHSQISYAVFCLKKKKSYMAVGFYVAKYVNKKSDMDLAAKGLGAKEWNHSLKTNLFLF